MSLSQKILILSYWAVIIVFSIMTQSLLAEMNENLAVFILFCMASTLLVWRLLKIPRASNSGVEHILNQLLLISSGLLLAVSRFFDSFHELALITSYGLALISLTGLLWGFRNLRKLGFPLIVLFLLIPLLTLADALLSFPMRLLSAQLAWAVLSIGYENILLQGTELIAGNARVSVTAACDGLNLFQNLIWISWLYVITQTNIKRSNSLLLMLVVSSVLIANTLRIAVLFIATENLGQDFLISAWHVYIGWAAVVLAMALFLFMDRIIHN